MLAVADDKNNRHAGCNDSGSILIVNFAEKSGEAASNKR
jgi:hypothetical protein